MTRDEAIENLQRLQNLLSNDPYINTQTIITTCNVAIEALKQEPCGDAISRQEALKLFATNDGKYLYEAIRDLPSVTPKQRWIPVSERVPEENGYYLTTTMYHEVYCDYWEEDRFNRTEAVTAWMPLPKPYVPDTNIGKMSEIPTDCSNLDSCENCKYDDGECCRLIYEAKMESEEQA